MSFAALPHYLVLLRNAVDKLRHQSDADRQATLDLMRQVIARMMIEATVSPELDREAADGFAAARGAASAGSPEAELASVLALLGDRPSTELMAGVLSADQRRMRAYEKAVLAEVAAPPYERAAASLSPEEIGRLQAFLRTGVEGEADALEVEDVRLASMGYSKKTILVGLKNARVLPREIVIRMDQAFNFLGTTVLDEFGVVKLLHAHGAPVPKAYVLEPTGQVLGHPFIVFERVAGDLMGTSYFPPARNDRLTAGIARALARIHATPLAELEALGLPGAAGAPYIEGEIERVHRDWMALGPPNAPTLDVAFAWIRANAHKAVGRRTIIHNDFNYHNFLVAGDELTAVLDWEFAHIGNPAADLGYFHEVAERNGGFDLFLKAYEEAGGVLPSREELEFYILWGHVRFGVMGYQSEAGLNSGQYEDVKYATSGVNYLRKPLICIGDLLPGLLGQSSDASNSGDIAHATRP